MLAPAGIYIVATKTGARAALVGQRQRFDMLSRPAAEDAEQVGAIAILGADHRPVAVRSWALHGYDLNLQRSISRADSITSASVIVWARSFCCSSANR